MAHSLNSPSSFSRRRGCPGSAGMEKDVPDKENPAAALGTAAHALGEKCLLTNYNPDHYLGEKFGEFKHPDGKIEEFIVDGEMADNVQIYVDYCRSLHEGDSSIEQKFNLPFLGKDEKGTADFATLQHSAKILHVVDYKNGVGYVDAFENIQGLCYGLGAAANYEDKSWDTLRITIVQPRAYGKDPVRSWDVPRNELMDWKMDLAEAAEKTRDPNAPLIPGSHCGWCKAKQCKVRANGIQKDTRMDFESPNSQPVNPDLLSDDEMFDIVFNKIPIIKQWCSSMLDYAQLRAEEKNPIPGTKLVPTRASRKWKDLDKAEAFFKAFEGAYERKFKTAPQMEKLLGKKAFAQYESEYVEKKSTGVTLAQDTDARVDAKPIGESEFGAVKLQDYTESKSSTTVAPVNLFG